MRAVVLVPLSLVIAAALGWAGCRLTGATVQVREMVAAAMTCLLAGELAALPLLLVGRSIQANVAQAALVGTLVHLMVSLGVAAVVLIGKISLGPSYVYWLLGFYWMTLIVLVVAFAQAVKAAPVTQLDRD